MSTIDRSQLRNLINDGLDVEDLKNLVFDLGLDWGNLGGDETPKIARIRQLIQVYERQRQVHVLLQVLATERPDLIEVGTGYTYHSSTRFLPHLSIPVGSRWLILGLVVLATVSTLAIGAFLESRSQTITCPVNPSDDEEAVRALIQAEAERAMHRDLDGVLALFDDNAQKFDKQSGQVWKGKAQIAAYYRDVFQNGQWVSIIHSNPVVTVSGTTAIARNDSEGTYVSLTSNKDVRWSVLKADGWMFTKTRHGCWLIIGHRMNLGPDDP